MTISFNSRVVAPPDVLIRDLEGESVLLNLDSEAYFGLDEVGTRMWYVLTTSESIQAAYEILLDEYEVEGDRLREDLMGLVKQLATQGLVELSND